MRGPAVLPIVIAAGGTGGHFFPAEALASELLARGRRVALLTDARSGGLQSSVFAGLEQFVISGAGIAGRGILRAGKAVVAMAGGVMQARQILTRIHAAAVVGFGGYPCVAPVLATRLMRHRPTVILHEQNAVLGRANRMLAKGVTRIATSFERTKFLTPELGPKVRLTGNPVRSAVIAAAQRPYWAPERGGPIELVVFGGSQGARFFADALPPALMLLPETIRANLFVVQQCREEDLARVEKAYQAAGVRAHLATFFANLPEEMAKAHLVIGRAGASTVAELTVMGRPAVLVPLPHAVDNDQLQNAIRLAESDGAWCIEQKDLSAERLASVIGHLLQSPQALAEAAAAAKRLGQPEAVTRLADLVEELIGSRAKSA
jgi:UDP-N-acetylglucosamine--N-acetylmuramyl-(pentapeptide) pyrophosphoryl-undecaprenol N-acetylglucosamine transferase